MTALPGFEDKPYGDNEGDLINEIAIFIMWQPNGDVAATLFGEFWAIVHHPNDTGARYDEFMDRIERMGFKPPPNA